jgi:hypothetical protein
VIVQQINLYQDRFREKRKWISAGQLAAALVLALALLAGGSYLLRSELVTADQRSRELMADRNRLTADLQAANAELAGMLQDTGLDHDIETTARKISARKQVLNFVDGNQFGSGQGFSAYLVALSNLYNNNIWLNEVHLMQGYVRIEGSALEASEIPLYFTRFGDEPVFRGDQFSLFQLNRDKNNDWKVDFEIATSGAVGE